MRIKWLHLSDIHFNYKDYKSHSLREDFLKRIDTLCQSEPFTHLFLTGDVLYRNQLADEGTVSFINSLMSKMGVSADNVFVIPGNHDHDRNITEPIVKKILKNKKRKKNKTSTIDDISDDDMAALIGSFSNYYSVYNSIIGENYYSENATNPHVICTKDSLSVIKLNTAWLDDDSSKTDDFLRIGARHLQLALTSVFDCLKNTVNIAIGHHTLEDMIQEERNRTLDQFKRNNIGLYFCGHRHKPYIKYHSEYDVLEFVAPGAYNDGYSEGGYIWGIIDTDTDFYKAEVYGWYDNKWCIESKLNGTDEYGIYYFHTDKFQHHSDIAAIDCKIMGPHIPKRDLEKSIGCKNFDTHIYNGPYEQVNGYTQESINDFSNNIIKLIEKNKVVHLYPLAPIPMLISLGFNLQKNSHIIIHQFDRESETWILGEKFDSIALEPPYYQSNGNSCLVVAISTSFEVKKSQIDEVMAQNSYDYVHFKTSKVSAGYPLYEGNVNDILNQIMNFLDSKINDYKDIHVFAAIPAGMAVEFGRRMLKSVYSNIHTYQLTQSSYDPSLIINPKITRTLIRGIDFGNAKHVSSFDENMRKIPYWGKIACGQTKDGRNVDGRYFPVLESILDSGEYFVIEADGDSMINAGIDDGDYIVVKAQPVADHGDIVVALVERETTLKRLFYDDENKKIVLHPENEKYSDVAYDELEVQGVAVHVIKNLS